MAVSLSRRPRAWIGANGETEVQMKAGEGVSHSNTREKRCGGGMERSMQVWLGGWNWGGCRKEGSQPHRARRSIDLAPIPFTFAQ